MSLVQRQREFLDALSNPDDRTPVDLVEGRFAIYRNAYRVSLVDALAETFPRTKDYTGDEPFRAAAVHHVISHPSPSWTIDRVGDGFANTLEPLFPDHPEIADIARLEWEMGQAFIAADRSAFLPADFADATREFDERDWASLTLSLAPALRTFPTDFDLASWWTNESDGPSRLERTQACAVWREDERPLFRLIPAAESRALQCVAAGAPFGTLCETFSEELGADEAIAACGQWLAAWLQRGWIAGLATA